MKKIIFTLMLIGVYASSFAQYWYRPAPRAYRPAPRAYRPAPPPTYNYFYFNRPHDWNDAYRVRVGIQAGINFSDVAFSNFNDQNFVARGSKAGFTGGLFIDAPIVPQFHIQPEFNFSQKGFNALTDVGTFDRTYNFFEIPLIFKVYPVRYFNLNAGPQFSFLINTVDHTQSYNNGVFSQSYSTTDGLRKSFVGLTLGAGFDLGPNVTLGFNYAFDLQQNYGNPNGNSPDFKNRVFSIKLGAKF